MVGEGLSNKQIAGVLITSGRTVGCELADLITHFTRTAL